MKQLILFVVFLLVTISSFGQISNFNNVKREEIQGEWILSKESLLKIEKNDSISDQIIITNIHLNADSTASITLKDSSLHILKSAWYWKSNRKMLGLIVSSDVLIECQIESDAKNIQNFLGLKLSKKKQEIILESSDFIYVKR